MLDQGVTFTITSANKVSISKCLPMYTCGYRKSWNFRSNLTTRFLRHTRCNVANKSLHIYVLFADIFPASGVIFFVTLVVEKDARFSSGPPRIKSMKRFCFVLFNSTTRVQSVSIRVSFQWSLCDLQSTSSRHFPKTTANLSMFASLSIGSTYVVTSKGIRESGED